MITKKIYFSAIAGMLLLISLIVFSCNTKRNLERKYNQGYDQGYSKGNDAGYSRGRTEGYNAAKGNYEKQISELQNKITTTEKNHQNTIAMIEANHKKRVAAIEVDYKKEIADSYDRGFHAGTIAMEEKIVTQIELNTQQRIENNRRNGVLFGIRRQ